MFDLNKCIKYRADRGVDPEATLAACADTIEKWNVSRDNDMDRIQAVSLAVFARYPGVNLSMDALKGYILQELKFTPKTHAMLAKRIEDHVKEKKGVLYNVQVGKGVSLIPQAPATEPAPAPTEG